MTGIGSEVLSAEKYDGMYFAYPNEVGKMKILVETDTGMKNYCGNLPLIRR